MIAADDLPTNIQIKLGESTRRYLAEEDFQAAIKFAAVSLRNSYIFNENQFEREDGLENVCRVMEASLQNKFEFPIVMYWRLENGKAIFYFDVFFENPNAPFSHSQGVLH